MSKVSLQSVRKVYGDNVAVESVSLTIDEGEFVTLLGASGSGKTTCLRMVAGFVLPSSGKIIMGDADVTRLPPHKRNTAMVFQQYALFPHLTVAQNVAFGLSVRKVAKTEMHRRVSEALEQVRLGKLGERYPHQLSGGQRQRVALARAVVLRPHILLLDEPLGALDLKLREELQTEIKRVQSELGITTLFVTHDQSEALSMSDRIAVMKDGRIEQIDTPANLYSAPGSEFVARFVGRITFVSGRVSHIGEGGVTIMDDAGRSFSASQLAKPVSVGDKVGLAIRPESYRVGAECSNRLNTVIEHIRYQGAVWTATCRDEAGISHLVDLPTGSTVPQLGDRIPLSWADDACRVFPSE